MASHWKSTPNYWCKFCSIYVRDTSLERKNHETSSKHQNNIQRSLRELHKTKEREDREKQRAKDEVARLNNLVGGSKTGGRNGGSSEPKVTVPTGSKLDAAAQRKAHAEQLAALGVKLPDHLQQEVSGVGQWETVSTRVVEEGSADSGMSMADILKQEQIKAENGDSKDGLVKGIRKRKADAEDDGEGEEAGRRKKAAWGSRLKAYPGKDGAEDEGEDLDALLSGVGGTKKMAAVKDEIKDEDEEKVTLESTAEDQTPNAPSEVKEEGDGNNGSAIDAPPVPVFKKRKVKK